MKKHIKKILLIIFTLSILVLNIKKVLSNTTSNTISPDLRSATLTGRKTYFIKNGAITNGKQFVYKCNEHSDPSNLIEVRYTDNGCEIDVKSFKGPNKYGAIKIEKLQKNNGKTVAIISEEITSLTLIANEITQKSPITVKLNELKTLLPSASMCSFNESKYINSQNGANLSWSGGQCSFKSSNAGQFEVYTNSNNFGPQKHIIVVNKRTTKTKETKVKESILLQNKGTTWCSFSETTKSLYKEEAGTAGLSFSNGQCTFNSNYAGNFIVYTSTDTTDYKWIITVVDQAIKKPSKVTTITTIAPKNTKATTKSATKSATKSEVPATTEIKVSKITTASDFTPGYRFVTNSVTGTSLTCGDKVYISSCDGLSTNPNSKCTISERNGIKPNSNLTINRNALSINEPTDCEKIIRYSIEAKAFTNSNLREGELLIPCGAEVVFEQLPYKACNFGQKTNNLGIESGYQYCEVEYNGQTIYVDRGGLATNKPSDSVCNTSCIPATPLLKQTSTIEKSIKICYKNNENKLTSIGADEFSAFKCDKGYRRIMKEDPTYNTCNELLSAKPDGECSKVFLYSCVSTARPTLKGSGNLVRPEDGKGSLIFQGFDSITGSGLKGYFIYTDEIPTLSSIPTPFENSNYDVYENLSAGLYFVSVMTNDNVISYPLALSVYSDDITTTADINLGSPDGKESYLLDGLNDMGATAYNSGIMPSRYVLLSNKLSNDSILASGFDLFTTAYQVNVEADKIAVYATLTSSDAYFAPGYGPRTADLNYGKNTILVKIINKEGKERTYTFIVNRKDNRENDNILSDLKPSVGNINFDPYVTDYTISVPKNTKTISINAALKNNKSYFVSGYEPRIISLDNDITSATIRTVSEAGLTRNYVLTFVKKGTDVPSDINSTYLSSLTIPGTEIMFNKETENYNVSVEYEIDNVDIYAFAESSKATVSVEGNNNLNVGPNKIEIIVSNGSTNKLYNVHINRKEDSLGVSNNTKLDTLTIKDYDLFFDPDVNDYKVKIKREKTLLLTATPASNRSLVYMEGNNDLTAFSTVRVKVIAENGEIGLYSIDITKDLYNAKFETTAAIIGALIIVGSIILLTINKKRKSLKEYIEE